MKAWGVLLFFISALALADVSVITDLDDTLKITQSNRPCSLMVRMLTRTVYGDVRAFYQNLPHNDLYIVSASPSVLRRHIQNTLNFNHIEATEVQLKRLTAGHTYDYKMRALRQIIQQTDDKFVLIGDNTSHDARVFLKIQQEFPERVAAIYIRQMLHREVPAGATGFYTHYEVALDLYQRGLMTQEGLERVAQRTLQSPRERLLPGGHICPEWMMFPFTENPNINHLSQQVAARIMGFCS